MVFTLSRAALSPTTEPITVVAGQLPLRSWRSVPRLLVWTRRVRRSLSTAPGLLGYRFGYDVRASALWMMSAWSTRTELIHFERRTVHLSAMADLRPFLRPSTFVVWTTDNADEPFGWDDARRRIRAVESR